jgi:biotin carboxyl carrier protein
VRFTVEAGVHRRTVALRRVGPDDDQWMATVDGVERPVRLVRLRDSWSMLLGSARAGHYDSYDVRVEPRGRGAFGVHVGGAVVPVTVGGATRGRVAGGHEARVVAGGGVAIVAPMPGRVIKVLARVGDPVEARQGLVVVEAMKMENELRSPSAGIVREILVAPGMSVDAQAVLVVVGPPRA